MELKKKLDKSKNIDITMQNDNVLEQFYTAILENNENFLKKVHLPRSDVFYVQKALEARTGITYSLDRIERAMYLEGFLSEDDVYKPEVQRAWEVKEQERLECQTQQAEDKKSSGTSTKGSL